MDATSNRYLFKNYLDGFLYITVYFIFPLYSLGVGAFLNSDSVFITALPCCISVMYDGISRYDKLAYRQKLGKIVIIVIINFVLIAYTIGAMLFLIASQTYCSFWWYLLLLVAPFFGVYDLTQMAFEDWRSRPK